MARNGTVGVAILGPGNIGTDLMYKIRKRSECMELALVAGIYAESRGLALAADMGIPTSSKGIDEVLRDEDIRVVFDATSAHAHMTHAPLLKEAGKIAIDLTPAAIGPPVCPVVNLDAKIDESNFNLITCGGQATIPIVYAVSRVTRVPYAEIVAVISSASAGPGTRQNIDEFTRTTAEGLVSVGGAGAGKAIILLNPADPPLTMNNTIYLRIEDYDDQRISESVEDIVSEVQGYVPGYHMKIPPTFDGEKLLVMIQVAGAGDFLPPFSGNLDIQTSAAVAVGERVSRHLLGREAEST